MIDEFSDREVLGTAAGVASVTITEQTFNASIAIGARETDLTSTQCRKLARHLNRIARRIEDRNP